LICVVSTQTSIQASLAHLWPGPTRLDLWPRLTKIDSAIDLGQLDLTFDSARPSSLPDLQSGSTQLNLHSETTQLDFVLGQLDSTSIWADWARPSTRAYYVRPLAWVVSARPSV